MYVVNFSQKPINITTGQIISQSHDPSPWLNSGDQFMKEQWKKGIHAHANLLRSIINSGETSFNKNPFVQTAQSEVMIIHDASQRDYSAEELLAEHPVEGGPKTAEMPEEHISMDQLLKEVDISPNLTPIQIHCLQEVLERHREAFGLDGRLGNYSEEVDIPLLPGTKPISIPPYQASPASREVIDKHMDTWIQLGVIASLRVHGGHQFSSLTETTNQEW